MNVGSTVTVRIEGVKPFVGVVTSMRNSRDPRAPASAQDFEVRRATDSGHVVLCKMAPNTPSTWKMWRTDTTITLGDQLTGGAL